MAEVREEVHEVSVLKVNYDYLVNSIEIDSVLPVALSSGLISERQKSECSNESGPLKKSEKFLDHLLREVNGDSRKYYTFLEILQEKQPLIYNKLQPQPATPDGKINLYCMY